MLGKSLPADRVLPPNTQSHAHGHPTGFGHLFPAAGDSRGSGCYCRTLQRPSGSLPHVRGHPGSGWHFWAGNFKLIPFEPIEGQTSCLLRLRNQEHCFTRGLWGQWASGGSGREACCPVPTSLHGASWPLWAPLPSRRGGQTEDPLEAAR